MKLNQGFGTQPATRTIIQILVLWGAFLAVFGGVAVMNSDFPLAGIVTATIIIPIVAILAILGNSNAFFTAVQAVYLGLFYLGLFTSFFLIVVVNILIRIRELEVPLTPVVEAVMIGLFALTFGCSAIVVFMDDQSRRSGWGSKYLN